MYGFIFKIFSYLATYKTLQTKKALCFQRTGFRVPYTLFRFSGC
jgi:hypothetical protein